MKEIYKSPNYKPENVTNKYLHVDLSSNDIIIEETQKTAKTNYTIRSYILPITEHHKYSKVIAEAQKLKGYFPYCVDFKED